MQDPAIRHLVDVLLQDQRERSSGGIERFLANLALEGGRRQHEEWACHPYTRVVLDALKSLAETVPLNNPSDLGGMAKALGCMSGLGLAVKFIEDPTRVFPSLFDGDKVLMSRELRSDGISETYDSPPDGEERQNKEK